MPVSALGALRLTSRPVGAVALRDRLLASRRALRDVMGAMPVPDARGGSRAQMGQCGADKALAGLDDVSGRICPGSWHGRGERVIGGRAVTVEAVAGLCSRLPDCSTTSITVVVTCSGRSWWMACPVSWAMRCWPAAVSVRLACSLVHRPRMPFGRPLAALNTTMGTSGRAEVGADMADVRDRRGAQPVLVAEHPLPGYSLLCTERQHAFTYDAIFPA
jgi:hypothetical protein